MFDIFLPFCESEAIYKLPVMKSIGVIDYVAIIKCVIICRCFTFASTFWNTSQTTSSTFITGDGCLFVAFNFWMYRNRMRRHFLTAPSFKRPPPTAEGAPWGWRSCCEHDALRPLPKLLPHKGPIYLFLINACNFLLESRSDIFLESAFYFRFQLIPQVEKQTMPKGEMTHLLFQEWVFKMADLFI